MGSEKPDQGEAPERPKRKRAAPTIELKASSVSDQAPVASDSRMTDTDKGAARSDASSASIQPQVSATDYDAPKPPSMETDPLQSKPVQPEPAQSETHASPSPPRSSSGIASLILPAVAGAVAAAAVVAIVWVAGLATRPASVSEAGSSQTAVAAADSKTAADALAARVSKLEALPRAASPDAASSSATATDAQVTARLDALEKSAVALGSSVDAVRADNEKLGKSVGEIKTAQADAPPPADLTPLDDRIAKLEKAIVSLTAQAATPPPPATPPENPKIRTAVAATALDSAVRQGEPYTVMLSNVASSMDNGDALKPLEPFAAGGVPSAKSLCGELLALVAKADAKSETHPSSGDVFDRLRASASKLVKIERTDSPAAERTSALARIAAAAGRNDVAESKREVTALSPADRAPFQAWLDKVAARDAALNAARQVASDAMQSLSSPSR